MEKVTRIYSETIIDENTVFYKQIEESDTINLGIKYFEDGKLFEDTKFYSYPYLEYLKYDTIIGEDKNIYVIENKKIACMYNTEFRRRIPTKIVNEYNGYNDLAKPKVIEKK